MSSIKYEALSLSPGVSPHFLELFYCLTKATIMGEIQVKETQTYTIIDELLNETLAKQKNTSLTKAIPSLG